MADSLQRYAAARDDVAAALDGLRDLLAGAPRWFGAADDLAALTGAAERLRTGPFVLAVVGEFSSGKSFLLNALLGKIALDQRPGPARITGLLATDINPSTATITELSYAAEERAVAYFADGREERVPLDGLAKFETEGVAAVLRVGIDSEFLRNGFVVADTPGLASIDPAHRRATLRYLPSADAVLYLIDTQQPFTDGDAAFLGIVRQYIESIFIVQTKIDLWRAREAEREAWQAAAARIVAQAALHAPETPVFPLSAREYAEGRLTGSPELVAQSRFLPLLEALDASLVATTGRSRLRRTAAQARRIAGRAAAALALEAAALETEPERLRERRASVGPELERVDAAAAAGAASLTATGTDLRATIGARGERLREQLLRGIARAFDISDVAQLRDRAKLHIIVDRTVAAAMGTFAGDVADLVTSRLSGAATSATAALTGEGLPIAEDAARAFDADPGTGAWGIDLETGLRGTIVLGALGGPAVSLVVAIAARFAAAPFGSYMKRELTNDMASELAPAFERNVAAFVDDVGERVERIAGALAVRVAALAARTREETLGAIDRALAAPAGAGERAALAAGLRDLTANASACAAQAETRGERFAESSQADRRALADPAIPLDPLAGRNRVEPNAVRFDPQTYEHGLRPERWRVVVVGALRRGKSSLINAIAERRVLADEGGEAEFRFPVHVRYGTEDRVYALTDDAVWDEIASTELFEAAMRTPVLVVTPWSLPHELVLVHTPAFDSGIPGAEDIVLAAAAGASELLALFSRQLSDRELELYGRIARLEKPTSFVHTIADNETPSERRNVVDLADLYLRKRAIVPQRIFTVSTRERGPWNELGALRSTLQAHAEEHMERLRRARREQTEHARLAAVARPVAPANQPTLFQRIFGRRQ